jgi:glycosyltransferase involved in cell wall biosynthesis
MTADEHTDVTAILTAMTDAERPWVMQALQSVLRQTRPPDRIVLLVADSNVWIEKDLASSGLVEDASQCVQIHRIPLARAGAVRNTGVGLARTKWVAFLDGDDVWENDRLEWQLAAARLNPAADFIGGDYVFINEPGKVFAYSNGSTPATCTWLVARRLMVVSPFHPTVTYGEDYLWLKSTADTCQRVRVPKILARYRIRGQSISSLDGMAPQRRRRELMARVSRNALIRYPMLALTFLRYYFYRNAHYRL